MKTSTVTVALIAVLTSTAVPAADLKYLGYTYQPPKSINVPASTCSKGGTWYSGQSAVIFDGTPMKAYFAEVGYLRTDIDYYTGYELVEITGDVGNQLDMLGSWAQGAGQPADAEMSAWVQEVILGVLCGYEVFEYNGEITVEAMRLANSPHADLVTFMEIEPQPIPEPGLLALMGLGFLGLGLALRKQ